MRELPPDLPSELVRLMAADTVIRTVELGANRFAFPDESRARADEVCMVFRRARGDILTFRKTFYPRGVYRLPTGGIKTGESVVHALIREVREETGWAADHHRLAAVVAYHRSRTDPVPRCHTFAFLLDDIQGTPIAADPQEQVEDFRWVEMRELLTVADALETLSTEYSADLESSWRDWGIFRAVVHRVLWDVLRSKPSP